MNKQDPEFGISIELPFAKWLNQEIQKMLIEETIELIKLNSTFKCSIEQKHPPHWWEPIEGWTEEPKIGDEWCLGNPTAQWKLKGPTFLDDYDTEHVWQKLRIVDPPEETDEQPSQT